jgi:phosphohistidine phosphatase
MKKLVLLRHAKSSWKDRSLGDHDRPLAKRGLETALLVGKYIRNSGLTPEFIVCSTAKRARQTLKLCLDKIEKKVKTVYTNNLYYSSVDTIVEIISKVSDKIDVLMLVGHNPDLENLVEYLTGKPFPFPKFNTAGLMVIEFDFNSWQDVDKLKGKVVLFKTPKMLNDKR